MPVRYTILRFEYFDECNGLRKKLGRTDWETLRNIIVIEESDIYKILLLIRIKKDNDDSALLS